MTLRGARALRDSSAVLAPASLQRSFASLLSGKDVASPFQWDHAGVVRWVEERRSGGPVAFLVPGDFSAFCPFQSFAAHFRSAARVIPGVGAHAAAAARLAKGFDLAGVAHATVLTSTRAYLRDGGRVPIRDYARPGHTLVIYMNDVPLATLVEELRAGFGTDVPVAILEKVSCPEEQVTLGRLSNICALVGKRDPFGIEAPSAEPALALVVAGDALDAEEPPEWWDRRYEKIWKPRGVM